MLVDGEFVQDKYDISLRFRGSSNQRIIDMNKTRAAGKIVLWQDDPIFADHKMERRRPRADMESAPANRKAEVQGPHI